VCGCQGKDDALFVSIGSLYLRKVVPDKRVGCKHHAKAIPAGEGVEGKENSVPP